jgi:hypothetical protein
MAKQKLNLLYLAPCLLAGAGAGPLIQQLRHAEKANFIGSNSRKTVVTSGVRDTHFELRLIVKFGSRVRPLAQSKR